MSDIAIGTARRWSMLAIALTATLFANVFINGAAFLIPTLHSECGLDLAQAGLLSSLPSFGMVATLIAWGYLVDRVGERIVLTLGSALTAAAAFAAASVSSLSAIGAFLLLGGMAAASSNSASGRLVVGWFPPEHGRRAQRPRRSTWPTRTADRRCCGVSTPSRYCWSFPRLCCGHSRSSG
jgi:sugar phosphate permease